MINEIVQINKYEYEQLCRLANMNQAEIDKEAKKLWEENAVAKISVTVEGRDSDIYETFDIKCWAGMWIKDDRFRLPDEVKHRFDDLIEDGVNYIIQRQYGDAISMINKGKQYYRQLVLHKKILTVISASGWAAFAACLCKMLF